MTTDFIWGEDTALQTLNPPTQLHEAEPAQSLDFWRELANDLTPVPECPDPTTPERHRNGFNALRTSDPTLYRRWTRHIRLCFDAYDWILRREDGNKPRVNTKDILNWWLNRDQKDRRKQWGKLWTKPRQMTLRDVEDHCEGTETVYYTSHPFKRWGVLLLDIDDKTGEAKDAPEVCAYLMTFFPGFFNQVSTGGKGWHGFLFVHYPDMSTADFRQLVKRLEDQLQKAVHARFRSTFEIKGTPALLNPNGSYQTCGMPAKLPRLGTPEAIRDYLARPVYTPAFLGAVIRRLAAPPASLPSLTTTDMHTEPVCVSVVGEGRAEAAEAASKQKRTAAATKERGPAPEGKGPKAGDDAQRMAHCGWNLTRELGRPATADEILTAYVARGLATGEDEDGNRARLAERSATWCAQHYEPSKAKAFDLTATVELIRQHVTKEIRQTIRQTNRSDYTDDQLAAVLYGIEKSATTRNKNPRLQFTVPNDSLVAALKTLGLTVEGTAGSVRNRLSTMKRALVAAELAQVVDPNWDVGKGKCYGLGNSHPRFVEYVAFRNLIQPRATT